MEKPTIKIDFVDFYGKLLRNKTNNWYYEVLSEKYNVVISDEPDFIICSVYDTKNYLKYKCPRIFITGENVRPNFNLYDYAVGFDYMEYEDRYFRHPFYMLREDVFEMAKNKHKITDEEINKKRGFCNFCYTNNKTTTKRDIFMEKLSQYKTVDSGGNWKNNIGYRVKDKIEWQRNYKFSIAFENSVQNGYVTEKLVDAFAAGTIPIYMGDPKILEEFNEEAFILCRSIDEFDDVIERVIQIDKDDVLFKKMLKAPMLKNPEKYDAKYGREAWLNFFTNIFEQEPQKAIRRNGFEWEKKEEKKEELMGIYEKILYRNKLIQFMRNAKKFLIRIKQKTKINA